MSKKRPYDKTLAELMDSRCMTVKCNLDVISKQHPRAAVLYPMMEKTIYLDFETLIATTIEDADAGNDSDVCPQSGDGSGPHH